MILLIVVLVVTMFYFKVIKVYSYWSDRGVKQRKQIYILGDNGCVFFKRASVIDVALRVYTAFPKERYMGMYQFLLPVLVVRDPELVKRITVEDFDHFVDHKPLMPDDDFLWSRNLFGLKGDRWHDMRSTLSPSLTTSNMKVMIVLISECAIAFMEHLTTMEHEIISLDLKDAFTRYANDVIASSSFGIKCNSMKDRKNEFYIMAKNAATLTGFWVFLKFLVVSVAPKLGSVFGLKFFARDVENFFTNTITEVIQTREKNNIIRKDMLNLLMEARKMKSDVEGHQNEVTDNDIIAQALLFVFAGFETVSTAMCLMGHELVAHPKVQTKLQEEVDEIYKECNGQLTYEALMKMQYMDMVVSETLRMWPPCAALDRICVKPYTIEPTALKEKAIRLEIGDVVSIPVIGFHRDPKYFPNPEVFDPERFSDENKHEIQPYTYLPFGSGPRTCLGMGFALMEIKTLFFHLVANFDLVPIEKTQIPLKLKPGLMMTSENDFWIGLKKRSNTLQI